MPESQKLDINSQRPRDMSSDSTLFLVLLELN